jgi:putative NIF3 family GTP cyclohydrolase 1 type 2
MISSQQLIERIQKNVGVPWQSQRSDGFSDGILFGSGETTVTGIATSFTPTLEVLRKAVDFGKNVVIFPMRAAKWSEWTSVLAGFGHL